MKIRIADRILVALAGLILIALCAGVAAQIFFGVPVTAAVRALFDRQGSFARLLMAGIIIVVLLTGIYCFLLLFRHKKRSDGFVVQKTENGELAISMKALEDLVTKCTDKHDEMTVESCNLENTRDGLMVRLKVRMAGGISIPMTVSSLQKQIRQYVTACSGVDVGDILVKVETGEGIIQDSPFAIAEPGPIALLKPAPDQNSGDPEQPAVPEMTELSQSEAERTEETDRSGLPAYEPEGYPEDDDRPMHQRIFRPEEEAQIVPCPPDLEQKQSAVARTEAKEERPEPSEENETEKQSAMTDEVEHAEGDDAETAEHAASEEEPEGSSGYDALTASDPAEEEETRDE